MLVTPLAHFEQDLDRARGLLVHARSLPEGTLHDDILRAAWMMAVGACDAYFCDAYADCVSRALRAKETQPEISIPDRLNGLRVPVIAVIRGAGSGWRWRMAARELIEDESVLSLEKIKNLFNHFFPRSGKLLNATSIEQWLLHPAAPHRLFGIAPSAYRRLAPRDQSKAREVALDHFQERFEAIFQRRHDCIHNCDRPKVALQGINGASVEKRIADVAFLVYRSHEALLARFPEYLLEIGFSKSTCNYVCA